MSVHCGEDPNLYKKTRLVYVFTKEVGCGQHRGCIFTSHNRGRFDSYSLLKALIENSFSNADLDAKWGGSYLKDFSTRKIDDNIKNSGRKSLVSG